MKGKMGASGREFEDRNRNMKEVRERSLDMHSVWNESGELLLHDVPIMTQFVSVRTLSNLYKI